MRARKFKAGSVNHVYQRTVDRFNIFYDYADYLVYFTMFCIFVRQTCISVWGLCLMIDHIHILIQCDNKQTLSDFISRVTSVYVRAYNKCRGRKGPLFEERFGSAPKADIKHLISSIIYVGNNPVERRLCARAEEFRWNFVAYMASGYPFSEKLKFKDASQRLLRAVRIVNNYASRNLYIGYDVLDSIFEGLSAKEKNQLVDYIIGKYNVINYRAVMSHFDTYEQFTLSMRSTTGSEYDLHEDKDRLSDTAYRSIVRELWKIGITDFRHIITMGSDEKKLMAEKLRKLTDVPMIQICKFLHLKAMIIR